MNFSPVSCKHAIIKMKGDNHTLFKIWLYIITAAEDHEQDEDDSYPNCVEFSTGIMLKLSKKKKNKLSNFVKVAKIVS